jgi:hypothetical protein
MNAFHTLDCRPLHIATVTLRARVEPGSEGVGTVADEFLKLWNQDKDAWTPETVLTL